MTRTYKLFSVALILAVGMAIIITTLDAQAFGRKESRPTHAPGRPQSPGMDANKAGWMFDRSAGMLNMLAKDLNLTPEQQGEITKILAAFQQEQRAKMQERIAAHRDLMNQMSAGEFDEAKAREFYQQMEVERGKMREDGFVERMKMMAQMKAVLTPEQITALQEKMDAFWTQDHPVFGRSGRFDKFSKPNFKR